MNGLNFLDTNVWLALVWERHAHSETARSWFDGTVDQRFYFSRFTQLALLRLLTNSSVMGTDVKSMTEAWDIYDQCCSDERIQFMTEPPSIDPVLRQLAAGRQSSPKVWADAYLASFATAAKLTLVTFDKALAGKTRDSVALGAPVH